MAANTFRRPTLVDVARRAGLSRSTVSAALLNDQEVAAKTRAKVEDVARRMGYVPNVAAATLATRGRTRLMHSRVAIVRRFRDFGDQSRYLHGLHYQTVRERLHELGHEGEVFTLDDQKKLSCRRLRDLLYHRGFNGIIFDQLDEYCHEVFAANWEPFSLVCWGRPRVEPPCDFFRSNYFESVCLAWREIQKAGYRRIGFLLCRHQPPVSDDVEREGAFAVCQAGATSAQELIPPFLGQVGDRVEIGKWFRRYRPEVVLGFNTWHYYCLLEMGLRIPQEVKYVDLVKLDASAQVAGVDHSEGEMRIKTAEHMDFLIRHRKKGFPKVRWGMVTPISWMPGESLPVGVD